METKEKTLTSFLSKNEKILSSVERKTMIDKGLLLVEKKQSTLPGTGDGLFAKVDLPQYSLIPYLGEFIDGKAVQECKKVGSPRDSYICYNEDDIHYDGYNFLSVANAAHANHVFTLLDLAREEGLRKQNGALQFSMKYCMWMLITQRKISAGEEIFVNYGRGYFLARPELNEVKQ